VERNWTTAKSACVSPDARGLEWSFLSGDSPLLNLLYLNARGLEWSLLSGETPLLNLLYLNIRLPHLFSVRHFDRPWRIPE